jgi:uncharacterized protein (TIGR01777 family)
MRIAITGATGLIGGALTSALEADGHDVLPVVRRQPAAAEVRWDPAAGEIDAAALEGLDGVVHLAGAGIAEKRWSEDRKRELLESRTKGTTLLADALASLSTPPPVLVGGSAIGWYGNRPDEVLTEADEQGGGFLADLVAQWEASYAPAEAAGIRVAKARTGIVLAGGGGALKPQLPLFKLGLGGRLGPGDQVQSWITLDDEVRALRFLLEHDVSGPVNLTAPNPVTNGEMAKAIGRAVHRPVVLPTPAFGPKLLFGGQLVEELMLYSQDVRPTVLQDAGFEHHHTDVDEALASVLS